VSLSRKIGGPTAVCPFCLSLLGCPVCWLLCADGDGDGDDDAEREPPSSEEAAAPDEPATS
jgi:hypothetical protein